VPTVQLTLFQRCENVKTGWEGRKWNVRQKILQEAAGLQRDCSGIETKNKDTEAR